MFRFQGWEPIVVLLLILLLFGPGRIAKIAKELGSSITAFRSGLKGEDKKDEATDHDTKPQ
ncbi:MAG: twin-arginine translocase TatA/TatE family subunit [Longilinea sp.]|nr:twin-arginine translocase TatA/TatE family subunit [Longilinea sp.]MCA1954792.1 twin-arginine translocase TatA/TatE family subunit [Anaerolinea sp.]